MKTIYTQSMKNNICRKVFLTFVVLIGLITISQAQVLKAFTQRSSYLTPAKFLYSIKGDYTMIGNTNLTLDPSITDRNSQNGNNNMVYVDADNQTNTLNSSSANLTFSTENGAIPECSNIIYAGLYWTGRAVDGDSPDTFTVTKQVIGAPQPYSENFTISNSGIINFSTYSMAVTRQGSTNARYVRYAFTSTGDTTYWFEFQNTAPYIRYTLNGGTSWINPTNQIVTNNGNLRTVTFDPIQIHSLPGDVTIKINSLVRDSRMNETQASYQTTATASGTVSGITTLTTVTKHYDKHMVSFMGPGESSYTMITATEANIYYPKNSEGGSMYSAYAEVTDYVKQHGIGNYSVADIALKEGIGGGTGFYGGWGLIVIYENSKMKWRDITVFDGHAYVQGSTTVNYELPVSGFKTVQNGAVNLKLGVMAGEGDLDISGDYFKVQQLQSSTWVALNDAGYNSTTNFFNSSINTGGGTRNPNLTNNTGLDIHMFNIPNANNSVITNNQTQTKFQYGSTQDTYVIFCIAMAVDAYIPDVDGLNSVYAINGQPVGSTMYVEPSDSVTYTLSIYNKGTEAVNNAKIVIPMPYTASTVSYSSIVNFSPANNTLTYNPSLGATGSLTWDIGNIPKTSNPDSLLAVLTYTLKVTTDCFVFSDTTCSPSVSINGDISGTGAISGNNLIGANFISGYQTSGNCVGEPIRDPVSLIIDKGNFVSQNCQGQTSNSKTFTFCNISQQTIPVTAVLGAYPPASRFFDAGNTEYTITNPFPATLGSTTYKAIGNEGCSYGLVIKVSSVNTLPSVTNVSYCQGATATALTANPTLPSYTLYYYNSTDVNESPKTSIIPSTASVGITSYYVAEGEGGYCISPNRAKIDVTVNSLPSCSITGSDGPVCPSNVITYSSSGMDTYSWSISGNGTITGSSNLSSVSVTTGSNCNQTFTLTLTVTKSECSSTCSKTVNVNETIAPTITSIAGSLNHTLQCSDATGLTNALLENPTATDNCTNTPTIHLLSDVSTPDLSCANAYVRVRTWNFTDVCGNTSASFVQTITVHDTQNPTITCAPVAANYAANFGVCTYTVPSTALDPSFSDNCSGASVKNNFNNLASLQNAVFPLGGTTVTWTVTDCSGNTATCNQTITVIDAEAPVAHCKNISINLSATGTASITATDINNNSTDNCGIQSMSVSPNSFSCSDVGIIPVTLTITDNSGNSSTCTSSVTINDPSLPSLSINDVTVTEGTDLQASFTVTMSGSRSCDVSFTVNTANNTALAPSDYTAINSQIHTIPAGQTSVTINVPIIDNLIAEPTETFYVNISNATYATIADVQGICTILDNDAASIAINDVSVLENAGNAVFTVTLTGNIQDVLTVNYATSNITALAGSDYTATSGTLTFNAGSASGSTKTITVPIINDVIAEPTETYNVNLSNLVSTATASISKATGLGTIIDDAVNDAVTLAINDVTVAENAGNAVFTVTLTGNIQDALTVNYATSNITALAGSDYTATSGILTFPAGSNTGATQTITVPILNDNISEPTETFNVTLSNIVSTGTTTFSDAIGLGTITDDAVNDAVTLAINDMTVAENAGNAVFTVTLTGNIQDALMVNFATSNITALAGSDYTATSGILTFPAGSISGATQMITVPILNDNISEPTETFNVTLSNIVSTGTATFSDAIGLGTITDDAINDAVSVAINDVTVTESAGNAVFTVTLTGNIQDALTVNYATTNGTALAGSDYTTTSGTVTFPAGSLTGTTKTISVPILNDVIAEPTETFNVNLSNIVSTGSATISDNLGIGTITDNDAASIAINDVTVTESAGNAVFTVTLNGNIQDALTVDYSTSNGTAIAGNDYTTTIGKLTFPAGSLTGTTKTISVPILNDVIAEPTETFNVNLSNIVSTGSATISDNLGIGTITDNDAASVAINDVTVTESAGNAIFTVTLTGNIQDALTVNYATSNGTALAGSDYTATSGTLTFPASSVTGATQTITVPILNNTIAEPTETFNVNLSNILSTGLATISDNLGIGTITDNDAASIAINDVTVTESAGNAVFTVTLTGSIQDALTVNYATSNGTALAGSDYTATSGTLTFPASSVTGATQTITVPILNNTIAEPTETFNVNLSNIVSTGSATISDNLGIGTITDNDAAIIAINDVTVTESAGNAVFTVTLTGNIQDVLTVDYSTSNGTAIAGSDYTTTSGTVTFPAGSLTGTTKTISVPILNDVIAEPTETFNVNLSNILSTGSATISDNLGIGTITDNDASSVAINDVTVAENAGNAVFTVTLTGNIQDALTVDFATSNGTALAGSDYTTTTGTLTFPSSSISGATLTITVPIINDNITEPTETFNVTLSNIVSTGSASISDALGIGTITDDGVNDAVSIAINDVTVAETAGNAVFTVTLTGNIQDALTVNFATSNGTALAGSDYTATSGILTFPANSINGATQSITVTIINNNISEPTETFNVNLSNIVSTGSASISDALGIGTIIDDNINDAVSIAINDVSVAENAGVAVFTVTLTGNIQDALTVDFATSNGTALAGSDYTASSGTVTFPANSITGATQSITIPIINDAISEPTETFNVTLSNIITTGSASFSDPNGLGTITDDAVNDAVSIAINNMTVNEVDGSATFTVTLTGNIQDALSVDFATSDITATAGLDYTANSGTVTFPANSINGATQTITVIILNDVIAEATETYNVTLNNIVSTGAASISKAIGVGTIIDKDQVSITINDVTVNESAGTATLTVTLIGNIATDLSVDYATSDGTAIAGSDYTTSTGTVTFVAPQSSGATVTINVPIINNTITEPTESFNVTLSNVNFIGVATLSDPTGIVTINDNDAASIAINDVTVAENAGNAVFTVTLTGNIQDALTVDYSTADVTALAGSDYTITTGTVTFIAGSVNGATQNITVPIINNTITEPTETFNVNLSNIQNSGVATISDNLGVGTITDDAVNDAVSVAINDVTVAENAGTAVFTVTLTGNIQDALTVDFATADVTALAGSDYTSTSGTTTFPAGSISGATQSITVPIINNSYAEPTETFTVTLSNIISTGTASISDAIGIGTITDDAINDAVSIAINDVTVSETAGNAIFKVTLTGNIQDALTVDFATADITALAGSDYTTTTGTLTFPAGSTNGTIKTITVPILNNSITEPTETFAVNLSNVLNSGTASISDAQGIGTILDDAINDAVSVAINDVTVAENAGTAVFTVTLTGNIQDALTVDFATSDVTANAGSDYTAASGTVTFPANSITGATQNITITIINDTYSEPTETFNVTLSNIISTGSASISDAIGIGTITDDAINDAVSVAINDVSVAENAGTAVFTVTLTGNIQDALTVDFATADITALAGSDYTATNGTLTFPAGSISGTTKTISVTILDDAITEPTETYNVLLSNIQNSGTATISDAIGLGTITDDAINDAVSVAINDVLVAEDAGIAVFTVTLTGNIQDALTVDFATSDITALAGSDYTATNGTLTFPAGSISGATQSISVTILNDAIAEPTETFNVTLSNIMSTGSASISDAIGLGTIIDDAVNDAVSVAIDDVTVAETAGNAVFTVTLTGNIQDALTVDFTTSDVTALAGSDYTLTSGTLTFLASSVSGTTKTITVPILNNTYTEPTETFNVNLSNIVSTGSASISDALGIGTIIDDAVNDAVSIAINDITVAETAGNAVFTVTLTGNIQDALTVDFATSDITALAGSDYTATSGTLTFPANSTSGTTKSITVPILNNTYTEPTETFNVTLSNIISTGNASISDAIGLGTITDDAINDAVSIAINDVTVAETDGTAVFTVTLSGNIQDALTVDFASSDITALAGSDYTATSGTLTFPAGSINGATQLISVPIINNSYTEPTETFNVTLSNIISTGTASISDAVGLGTIIDDAVNDAVSIAINDVTVAETAGNALFTVTLTGNIQDALTVDFATADVTALAGSDYTATSGTLTFPANSVSGTTKLITVPILNNSYTEPTETFTVTLSNIVSTGTASISDAIGIGTITDDAVNDAVSVAINDITVAENAGTATFTVTLTGNIQDALTVDFATANVTALAGSDYTAKSGTVTFPAGSISGATQPISITILNDAISEPTETFTVNLSNIINSGSASISDAIGIGTILDDAVNDAVSVAINDVTVAETAGNAVFTVTLTGNIQDALTVDFATSDITAIAGSDYTATSGTVTFPASSMSGTTKTIIVPILNNNITEPTETFKVTLSNIGSTGSASISDAIGIGTIIDDAVNDAVSIAINDVTIAENAGNAVFTVTLTGNIQDALTVDFATADITAKAGSDYTATSGTVTFPANSISGTTKTITVPILNDAVTEPTETFTVNLSNIVSTGDASISDATGLGTITDDAVNDAVSLVINDVSIAENAGPAIFTVTLTGNIQDALTVDFATSDITAKAGSDYIAKTGTVTFPAGSVSGATQPITITILNDNISEPTETYNVTLSNIVTTGSGSITDAIGLGTITDDAVNDAVSIAINDVTVAENAGPAVFTVTLTGNIQDALSVDFATADITAKAGSDYAAKSGTVTFPAGSINGATQSIAIAIINNTISEPTETFNVNLSNIVSTGNATISDAIGLGTIIDDAANDAVSIAINDITVSETSGNAVFTIALTGNIQDALTVDYTTNNGTALAGSDYTAKSGTITFPAGSVTGNTATISISIINDAVAEPTETFTVTLSNIISTGTATISDATGICTINDNDAISLAINDVTVNEIADSAIFTVTLTGNTQDALTVDFATADITALAGKDYVATSGTLTFPANSISGTKKKIKVTIINDILNEPTETYNVNLSNLITTGVATISDGIGLGTILDDVENDAANVAIDDVSVDESDGNAVFTVTLTGNLQDALTVDFATSNVTALAGSDYTAISGTLTFPAGSVTGATQTITVPIIDNIIAEPTETFNVNLSNIQNTGVVWISDDLGLGTIFDDASDGVSLTIDDVTVLETDGSAIFTVTLNGNIQDDLTVDYSTANVNAFSGSDYTATSGTLTFPAGSVNGFSKKITVPIINDMFTEPTENFTVNLANIVSTGTASFSDALGLATINDDDSVSVAINDVTVLETDGNAVFTLTLTGNIQDAMTIDFTTANGTALAGSDYTTTSGKVTFPAGSVSGAIQNITVPIINDIYTEPTEIFYVNLSNIQSTGLAKLSNTQGIGTITDDAINDAVTIAINDVTVAETDGIAVFTVTLTGNIQDALNIDYTTADGTAKAPSDYIAASGTLIFAGGSTTGTTQTITIPIVNNNITEPTEQFFVNLSNIQNSGNASISDAQGIGTITDDAVNDAVSISINDVTVTETDGNAVFTVTLKGNIQDALTVDFATADGTALAGSDYTATTGTVTFPPASSNGATQSITIPIVNNNVTEPTEQFFVNLSNIQNSGTATISDAQGIGTITDDAINDAVSIAVNDVTVAENAGSAVFTVTLTGNIQDALTVDYATADGTALSPSDYTATSGTVTFPAGSITGATQIFSIPIIDNNVSEPTEHFFVNLSNIQNTGTATISDAQGIGTITDDAINDAVSLSINDVTVAETDGNAIFTVTLTGNIQDALNVDFATSDGTAIAGSDYTLSNGTVTFAAGSMTGETKTITVPIIDNNIAEPTETFNVTLSNIVTTGTATFSDNIGIGTITDDEINTISLAGFTVTETNTSQSKDFVATMNRTAQQDVIITFTTTDGTATSGTDYTTQTAVSYTIPLGQTSVNIPVEILGDLMSEPTETFIGTIAMNNTNGQQITIGTAQATSTILDDDIADLKITKTGTPTSVVAGHIITYTITVENLGSNIAQTVIVNDVLPAGLTLISATPSTGIWTDPTWTIGTMPMASTNTITIIAKVNTNVADGTVIMNSATVSSSTTDPDGTNNTATYSNTVNAESDLAITKTVQSSSVIMGQDIEYKITVTNKGPSDAMGVIVTDTPPGISNVVYSTDNGTSWKTWSSPASLGTVVNGGLTSFILKGTVDINQCDPIINEATVSAANLIDANMSNNKATCTATPEDQTLPEIRCPGKVTIVVDRTAYSTTGVELGIPLTKDNCTVASVTNDAPVSYPLGNTNVIWTVTDASGNKASCTQLVVGPNRIFIPNGFSPDGDGTNDYFVITDIGNYPSNHFWVYNRWGNLVYDKKTYDNSWDGKLNVNGLVYGDNLPEGTYFYILDLGDNTDKYQGYIIIKR